MVEFNELSESQLELVYKAPVLVCILIAGADGEIDKKEIKEAIKIAEKETIKNSPLTPFFKVMAEDFEDKIA
jgi:tellurite resistance protein